LQELRTELDRLLQKCIVSPGPLDSQHDISLLNAIIDLVTTEEHSGQANQHGHLPTVSNYGCDRTKRRKQR